jgi:DNA-binding response OmpR family regulator
MRVLIVEDDIRIAEPLADDLRRQSHVVDLAPDGESGWAFAQSGVHDVVLLDVMLPSPNGFEICRRLRRLRSTAFVIMLTARDRVADKVLALDSGADDYIVKPFELDELAARIRAVARRGRDSRPSVIRRGEFELDERNQRVLVRGTIVELTRSEYALFETFMRHADQVFSRDMLQDRVRDFASDASTESIKTHITNLRKKLSRAGSPRGGIVTVYGAGYRLAQK